MPSNTDPAAVTDMARRREATTFHGDEAQFWVFDLADGGRVHIPPDQVRRLWNAEQLQQQLKGCECPARKALQRMMDEHGHDCDCIPMVLCEYCEGRAALSAPCPCEELPEIPCCPPHEQMIRSGATKPLDNCFVCIRNQRDELVAENAQLRKDYEHAKALADEAYLANNLCLSLVNRGGERHSSELVQDVLRHLIARRNEFDAAIAERDSLRADLAASQERERLLREALQPFASAVMQTRDMIAKMEALGRTCDWKRPMLVTEADWECAAAALATTEGTVRP